MQQKIELSDNDIINKAVSKVFKEMGITSVEIKEGKY
jgi:hypothetical protein